PRCHPETQKEMLDSLYNWAAKKTSGRSLHWLHGPAGAGKSALMRTTCGRLSRDGLLGASFFFKRAHPTRGNPKALFATLAYQLAFRDSNLRTRILETVESDPTIVGRDMSVQLDKLVVGPCSSLPQQDFVIVIDGLDECGTPASQKEILRLLSDTVGQYPSTFRILIASRPEAYILDYLREDMLAGVLQSTDVEKSLRDVETFLTAEFDRIHRTHWTMEDVPRPWPSASILKHLVEKSSGYFVYAATVIRF
ncbi:hypothetical protein C8F01DRAFT_962104, partial [Mycena amicta]